MGLNDNVAMMGLAEQVSPSLSSIWVPPPEVAGKHFFILWNPRSTTPPRVRFETLKEAQRIAEDMAQRHGEPFYVMKAVALAQRSAPPVETKKLK